MRIKNWTKKMAAGALALTMAASLAACGGGGQGSAPTPGVSAADALAAAQEALAGVTSMSYDMTMKTEMSMNGQTVAMDTTAVADYIVSPLKMKLDMTVGMGDQGSVKTTMYVLEEDNNYISYTGMDVGAGMTWVKQELEGMDALAQYDAKAGFSLYMNSGKDFTENGTDTVNGAQAVRYDGVISEQALGEVLEASGAMAQMSSLNLSEEDMQSMLSSLGDMPVSIWIAQDSGLPVKYEMDMTSVMQNMMNSAMESAGADAADFEVGNMVLSMTLSNINGVAEIEIPADALAS